MYTVCRIAVSCEQHVPWTARTHARAAVALGGNRCSLRQELPGRGLQSPQAVVLDLALR
jgi:hypothetical protein